MAFSSNSYAGNYITGIILELQSVDNDTDPKNENTIEFPLNVEWGLNYTDLDDPIRNFETENAIRRHSEFYEPEVISNPAFLYVADRRGNQQWYIKKSQTSFRRIKTPQIYVMTDGYGAQSKSNILPSDPCISSLVLKTTALGSECKIVLSDEGTYYTFKLSKVEFKVEDTIAKK